MARSRTARTRPRYGKGMFTEAINSGHQEVRVFVILASLFLVSHCWAVDFAGGTGAPNDPYQIATAQQLIGMGEEPDLYDKHFMLVANIDLSGHLFDQAVIAPDTGVENSHQGTKFSGSLDGHGCVISNLTIQGEGHMGLFGYIQSGARISNLRLEAVDVSGIGDHIGAIGGINRGDIISSVSTGFAAGSDNIGGLVGENTGHITMCYSNTMVSGDSCVGGLVGFNKGGAVTSSYVALSYSTGSVKGNDSVGGLVGRYSVPIMTSSFIISCFSTGSVTGNDRVGGLVGLNRSHGGIFATSFWDTETSGLAESAGGRGLPTAQMQDIKTYLDAGWDFVGETANGTSDFWQIQTGAYPRLSVFSNGSASESNGTGTSDDPYLLTNAKELGGIWHRPSAHYRLVSDIDLSGMTWGMAVAPWFGGSFNGNGHVIRNLHIDGGYYLGLFGYLASSAKISNLGLKSVDVDGFGRYIGGLAGYNDGRISASSCTGLIYGGVHVGGLVGYNEGCVTSTSCTASIRGGSQVGGLVGYNKDHGITNSHTAGEVSGDKDIGGLVGRNDYGSIMSSYSTGSVSGQVGIGGLAGANEGHVISSYSAGTVEGVNWFGGLVGENDHGRITSCYSVGLVRGIYAAGGGGLVGYNYMGHIASSFWDIETSGLEFSAGSATVGSSRREYMEGGRGLSTDKMQDINTYLDAGWDFADQKADGTSDFWQMQAGTYPTLAVFYKGTVRDPNGKGTLEDPYLITNANELGAIWYRPNSHYRLEADIDLSGLTWGMAVVPWFGGNFDGSEHVISNLRINGADHLGLFGDLAYGARVSSIGIQAMDVSGVGHHIGGLVGYSNGSITSCYSNGTVSGGGGGLVGYNEGRITSCYSTGLVSGDFRVGGLVGYNHYGRIAWSFSTASVTGNEHVGGLMGHNDSLGIITESYATGSAVGDHKVGGLVGVISGGSIKSTYSTALVCGDSSVGGLVGEKDGGSIWRSFWDIETSNQMNSSGGTPKRTTEMQDINTYLEVGWDFTNESINGVEDIWTMLDYPELTWAITGEQN